MGDLKKYFPIVVLLISCQQSNILIKKDHSETTVVIPESTITLFNQPQFEVNIKSFEVQVYEVDNRSFAQFVNRTGYKTNAEISGGGMVYIKEKQAWEFIEGANWKHPQGPGSNIEKKKNHPVVQISYEDACAYCAWMEMRLPFESEMEYLSVLEKEKEVNYNYWQGIFPIKNTLEDGFEKTSPVGSFERGVTGCYDLKGNVWEWCSDYFHQQWPEIGMEMPLPQQYSGPLKSFHESTPYDTLRVIKGGSFLCAENYCKGYETHARMFADPQLSYEHVGFRCVRSADKK